MVAKTELRYSSETDYIIGRHVYGNLYGVDSKILWDEEFLKQLVREAAEYSDMTILEIKSWRITGHHGGISVIALVLESHVAIHTWPEQNYATVDVYTCGEKGDPWRAFNYIISKMKPKRYTVHYADRSSLPGEEYFPQTL